MEKYIKPGSKAWRALSYAERHERRARIDKAVRDAAPEMLEALKNLYKHCAMIHSQWGDGCNREEADAAILAGRAVIKRAEGRA
jgi:hypothetical protein